MDSKNRHATKSQQAQDIKKNIAKLCLQKPYTPNKAPGSLEESRELLKNYIYQKYVIEDQLRSSANFEQNMLKIPDESNNVPFACIINPFFIGPQPIFMALLGGGIFKLIIPVNTKRSCDVCALAIDKAKTAPFPLRENVLGLRKSYGPKNRTPCNGFINNLNIGDIEAYSAPEYLENPDIPLVMIILNRLRKTPYSISGILSDVFEMEVLKKNNKILIPLTIGWMLGTDEVIEPHGQSLAYIVKFMYGIIDSVKNMDISILAPMLDMFRDAFKYTYNHFDPRTQMLCGLSNLLPNSTGWGVMGRTRGNAKAEEVRTRGTAKIAAIFISTLKSIPDAMGSLATLIERSAQVYEEIADSDEFVDKVMQLSIEFRDAFAGIIPTLDMKANEIIRSIANPETDLGALAVDAANKSPIGIFNTFYTHESTYTDAQREGYKILDTNYEKVCTHINDLSRIVKEQAERSMAESQRDEVEESQNTMGGVNYMLKLKNIK